MICGITEPSLAAEEVAKRLRSGIRRDKNRTLRFHLVVIML
jgi:hypothetical protein